MFAPAHRLFVARLPRPSRRWRMLSMTRRCKFSQCPSASAPAGQFSLSNNDHEILGHLMQLLRCRFWLAVMLWANSKLKKQYLKPPFGRRFMAVRSLAPAASRNTFWLPPHPRTELQRLFERACPHPYCLPCGHTQLLALTSLALSSQMYRSIKTNHYSGRTPDFEHWPVK